MGLAAKILSKTSLRRWRTRQARAGHKVVVTNGCFDLLHAGHASYLENARACGDLLLVGLTGDRGVRILKGPGRPLNKAGDRARLLAALESVNAVYIFPELEAVNFLKLAQPDIYVKGGDYTVDTINQKERRVLESMGTEIRVLNHLKGRSTSKLIRQLKAERLGGPSRSNS